MKKKEENNRNKQMKYISLKLMAKTSGKNPGDKLGIGKPCASMEWALGKQDIWHERSCNGSQEDKPN